MLAAAIAAVGAGALHEMRQDAYARAQEGAANLSLILEHDIARNLEIYELSMHSVIDGVKDPEILRLPPAIRQLVLFDRSTTATDMGSLLVTDEARPPCARLPLGPPRPVNLSDRDYFKVHRDSATAGLYVSQPFQPRLTDGGQSIGLSRRLSHADGSFATASSSARCVPTISGGCSKGRSLARGHHHAAAGRWHRSHAAPV
ncbi:PDC sensor domain-containing protein [Cupriavidus basilensis]